MHTTFFFFFCFNSFVNEAFCKVNIINTIKYIICINWTCSVNLPVKLLNILQTTKQNKKSNYILLFKQKTIHCLYVWPIIGHTYKQCIFFYIIIIYYLELYKTCIHEEIEFEVSGDHDTYLKKVFWSINWLYFFHLWEMQIRTNHFLLTKHWLTIKEYI